MFKKAYKKNERSLGEGLNGVTVSAPSFDFGNKMDIIGMPVTSLIFSAILGDGISAPS